MLKWVALMLSAVMIAAPAAEKEQDVFAVFAEYFQTSAYAPEGTELLSAGFDGETLVLNVTADIMNYGGGTAWELEFTEEMLAKAAVFAPELTLLIEGAPSLLPEGTEINRRSTENSGI